MQPKYASAFCTKKGKKSYGCRPCLFIRTRRLFPNPHWKIAEHEREVHSDKVNNGNVEHKHDREEIYPGEAPSEMVNDPDFNGQEKAGSLAGDRAACCYSQNTSYLRSGGRCIFSHTFQRNPLTGDWFDAIIFPVVTECTRDFHGPLAQLVRASGS